MKNLLVTGGCGFIGSNFINYYFKLSDTNIINLDAMYYCANEYNINDEVRKSNRYTLIKGNLCSDFFIMILKKSDLCTIQQYFGHHH